MLVPNSFILLEDFRDLPHTWPLYSDAVGGKALAANNSELKPKLKLSSSSLARLK